MSPSKAIYKCHICAAVSYQRVVRRDNNGVLQPTGQYRCTGCRNVFESLQSWWRPNHSVKLEASTVS
jgi:DNA-directed RNA polymerase subunit RPC12/RpoP